MSRRLPSPTATAPLLFWLALVCGLTAFSVTRLDHAYDELVPLWLGVTMGTAAGQFLAWLRLPALADVFLAIAASFLCIPGGALWGLVWTASFPAAFACGYALMSERWMVAAFWGPTMVWMLPILDRAKVGAMGGRESWLLLFGLVAFFLGLLHAKATRRVALWTRHGPGRLAPLLDRAVLRRDPGRGVAKASWLAMTVGAALLLTAWIAPKLWQDEGLPGAGTAWSPAAAAGHCCPGPSSVAGAARIHEYLPLLDAHDPDPGKAAACTPCGNAASTLASGSKELAYTPGDPMGSWDSSPPSDTAWMATPGTPTDAPVSYTPVTPAPPQQASAHEPPGSSHASPHHPMHTAPPAPPPTVLAKGPAAPAAPPPPLVVAVAPVAPPPAASQVRVPVVVVVESTMNPLPWLALLLGLAIAGPFALRPLRRSVALRHLRRPLWPEAIDQRVSNLWQLALVGLRDAGWTARPGEQPSELARRVGVDGMSACAEALERARHGVRLETSDVSAITRGAETAYAEARKRASWTDRVLAGFRWPLT